ncbi:MAG: hypothetical protein HFACDABA_00922 [Anaerolineales bacterium]|nr:hypothetical protein [Anaerolineales bacterium]
MNALEFFALYILLRVIAPVAALLGLGEWTRSRDLRRLAHR